MYRFKKKKKKCMIKHMGKCLLLAPCFPQTHK